MKRYRSVSYAAFLLVTVLVMLGAKCPSIPEIADRTVELAVAASTTLPLQATGSVDTWTAVGAVNITEELGLADILDEAGIGFDDVTAIKVSGVSYRVKVPDPDPTKGILSGTIFVQRASDPEATLISDFSENPVNAVVDFKPVPLQESGVAVLNAVFADLLAAVQAGEPYPPIALSGRGAGTATSGPTNFTWELKITLSITGKVTIDVLS